MDAVYSHFEIRMEAYGGTNSILERISGSTFQEQSPIVRTYVALKSEVPFRTQDERRRNHDQLRHLYLSQFAINIP